MVVVEIVVVEMVVVEMVVVEIVVVEIVVVEIVVVSSRHKKRSKVYKFAFEMRLAETDGSKRFVVSSCFYYLSRLGLRKIYSRRS